MALSTLPTALREALSTLSVTLDARLRNYLPNLCIGVLFARGRRTVASWLRGGRLQDSFPIYYHFLDSLGRSVAAVAKALLLLLVRTLAASEKRLVFAIDDTPTKRQGPKVQGAGTHHNPTPGAAGGEFFYGHVWLTVALLLQHSLWGTIGLPLRAWLYIRQSDFLKLPDPEQKRWKFRTKLEQAAEAIGWLRETLAVLGKPIAIVADGFFAKKEVADAARLADATFITRLRHDAALFDLPKAPKVRGRGRPRKYGQKISLSHRGHHLKGWATIQVRQYGHSHERRYKTFEAVSKTLGTIRVVLVQQRDVNDRPSGWVAFACTDPRLSVTEILEIAADRAAIEQVFHDVKEVHGAEQPQLRRVWANVGSFNLLLWWQALVEWWAWDRPHTELVDRSASPWDDPARRPSHADRCKALRYSCLDAEYSSLSIRSAGNRKSQRFIERLIQQAA
jgi:DDE superfamily endonuclease